MRFLIIRRADEQTEAGALPSQALMDAMARYMAEMTAAGVLRGGVGLRRSAEGARVTFAQGRATVLDGPFAEAKELVAGFSIIEVASRDEAIAWMRRWPVEDGDGNVALELRALHEHADFGEDFAPQMREQETRLRAAIADA